jgi:hypothetical protein
MKIANLERAAQIARDLPTLEAVRKELSGDTDVVVGDYILPRCVYHNLIAAVNAEINIMRKEVESL